jgi:hypothetical protein
MSTDAPVEINSDLVLYRLDELSKDFKDLNTKLDRYVETFVTREFLDLTLLPIQKEVVELRATLHEKEKNEANNRFQIRLALGIAFLGPILSFCASIAVKLLLG